MIYPVNTDQVPDVLAANLQGYSWSFSHFFLWRPQSVLFDCGEGVGIRLDAHVFRVETLAITHAHSDHCRGIEGFLEARAGLRGDKRKPLRIVYPRESSAMGPWIERARAICQSRDLGDVEFVAIMPGQSLPLANDRILKAQEVEHEPGEQCLCYRIGRHRRRIKAEFRHLSAPQIKAYAASGRRAEIEERAFECEFVYSGDARRIPVEFCQDAHVLIHESCFLAAEDSDPEKGIHANMEEVLRVAREAEVRCLVFFHVSRRYEEAPLLSSARALVQQSGIVCPVMLIRGGYNLPTD